MPAVNFSPVFNGWQGFTPTGLPMNGGYLYTYQAGTSTPLSSYTTSAGNITNSNPIQLGSDGRPPSEIWLVTTNSYKFVLTDSLLNIIGTYDNITGIDNSVPAALSEWVVTGLTPSYVSATQFTLAGDQTATFQVGQRVRYTLGSGQNTGSITASVYGALTTVTLVTDSIPLDNTLSAVDIGFLTALKPSVPTAFKNAVTAPSISTPSLALTGTGAGSIAADVYTPTITSISNITLANANQFQYSRVGNVITVSGSIAIRPTFAGLAVTEYGVSLPVASNLTATSNLAGIGVCTNSSGTVAATMTMILADTTNHRADCIFYAGTNGSNNEHAIMFSYIVQ